MEDASLDPKLSQLLGQLVEQYITSAQPVSSGALVDNYRLPISTATARNYMAELEQAGLVVQPHTSAGRIPTQQGYALYLAQLKPARLTTSEGKVLDAAWQADEAAFEARFKRLAKELAGCADQAVFVAFGKNDMYYTGLAHLFAKPEHAGSDHVQMLSEAIDQMDTVLCQIYQDVPGEPIAWIGEQNPFSAQCSTVLMKFGHGDREGVVGILGPMRMDYQHNLALMDHVGKLLSTPALPEGQQ